MAPRAVVSVAAATAVGLAATSGIAWSQVSPRGAPWIALALHALAASACWSTARLRGGRGVELDLVAVMALAVPVFGPGLAWTFVNRSDRLRSNAHAVFESYERETRPQREQYRADLFTGDFDRDLSRQLNTQSYGEVMRRGSMEQKRNLLRNLGRRAEPRHLAMLRAYLVDDDHELRLCAYAEIDRLSRRHEAAIADLRLACDSEAPTVADDDPWIALAEAQHDYATSGVLDHEMAQFWLGEAVRSCQVIRAEYPEHWRAARVQARCHAQRREFVEATACLAGLPREHQHRPEILLTSAEIAFARRDFDAARHAAAALRAQRLRLPDWLAALGKAAPAADKQEASTP